MSATVLYTPDVLGLAIQLARYPLTEDLPLRAEARSKSCGSTILLGLSIKDGAIDGVGLRSQACAIGQASAALFAAGAGGIETRRILAMRNAVATWLAGKAPLPQWPGIEIIAAAKHYPARHGAVMLPWDAALKALGQV